MNVFGYRIKYLLAFLFLCGCNGFDVAPKIESTPVIQGKVSTLLDSSLLSQSQQKVSTVHAQAIARTPKSGLKVQLYALNERGQSFGLPIRQTVTDSNGGFSFDFADSLSEDKLEYVVVASSADYKFIQEAAVTSRVLDIHEASSVAVKAIRETAQTAQVGFFEVTPRRLKALENVALGAILTQSIQDLEDAYDLTVDSQEFKTALTSSFDSDVSAVSLKRLPPDFESSTLEKDGVEITDMNFVTGDIVHVTTSASDPKGLPLQYKYFIFRNGLPREIVKDWSSSNELIYRFQAMDIFANTEIVVAVRNNDGVNADSLMFGDLRHSIPVTVHIDYKAPTIETVEISKNDVVFAGTSFVVGDSVKMSVKAKDPKSYPLEYQFYLLKDGIKTLLQAWSEQSSVEYKLKEEDLGDDRAIVVGVRNNDGSPSDGTILGDVNSEFKFKVSE